MTEVDPVLSSQCQNYESEVMKRATPIIISAGRLTAGLHVGRERQGPWKVQGPELTRSSAKAKIILRLLSGHDTCIFLVRLNYCITVDSSSHQRDLVYI